MELTLQKEMVESADDALFDDFDDLDFDQCSNQEI